MNLILDGGFSGMEHYVCELTKYLDELAGFSYQDYYELHHHYILFDNLSLKDGLFAIRVPGGTVGEIHTDSEFNITKIKVDTNYVVKTYVETVNEAIQKFVGRKLNLPSNWSEK